MARNASEEIRVGQLVIRFLLEGAESGESVAVCAYQRSTKVAEAVLTRPAHASFPRTPYPSSPPTCASEV
jgi:hypothetical protein